eukprot:9002010-Alexandrium_andersonii.AAC.1
MSASLVGSEMCIRDRAPPGLGAESGGGSPTFGGFQASETPFGPLARLRPQPRPAGRWLPTKCSHGVD